MATLNLRALAQRLLDTAKLEPANWLGAERGRGKPDALEKLGIATAREFAHYVELAEDPKFRKQVGAIAHRRGAFYWGVAPVRAPSTLLFSHSASEVVTFLMGSSVLATDPDSGAFLTATWGTPKSSAVVASFLFNDVAPSDRVPGDFVVEGLSIQSWLEGYGDAKPRPKAKLPECKELARLYRRGIWIAQLVEEDGRDDIGDIAETVRDASPSKLYEIERKRFATQPHLAAYWLLAHALLGRATHLADALAHTARTKNATVIALRKKLAPLATSPTALPKLFAKSRPDWSKADFDTLRSWGR